MKINLMFDNLKKFYRMIHLDHPTALLYVTIDGVMKAILPFVSLYYSSKILDALLAHDSNLAKQNIFILLAASFILGCMSRACEQIIELIALSSYFAVPKQTAYKAFIIQYEQFEKTETMDGIRRARNSTNGSGGVQSQIRDTSHLIQYCTSVIFSSLFALNLIMKSKYSQNFILYTAIILVIFVVFVLISAYIQKKNSLIIKEKNENNDHGNSLFNYIVSAVVNVQNGKDIRLYKMNKLLQHWFSYLTKLVSHIFYEKRMGKNEGIVAFLSQILAACVYIYVGVSVIDGAISIGDVLLYAGAITRFTTDVTSAMDEYNMLAYRFEYLNAFEEMISSKNMSYDGTLPIEKRDDGEYLLEFKNVSFKYPNTENYVLKNINLKFDLHKRLAIVGQNGAGKTTLIKLLCRLYEPTEGEILLNGVNISLYNYAEYTRIFSVVFQDFKLFPLPLDQNIACGDNVNQELVLKCIEDVGLKDTVEAWPDKEKTLLYKNLGDGVNVSGGEAQKIAIARALYKDAPFIIMDEPTAALDPLSEAEIYENFNELVKDKTSIFISHRMSSCKFCDEIVVFEDGEIVEKGSHQALLENHGLYRSLWEAQAQYYVDLGGKRYGSQNR